MINIRSCLSSVELIIILKMHAVVRLCSIAVVVIVLEFLDSLQLQNLL